MQKMLWFWIILHLLICFSPSKLFPSFLGTKIQKIDSFMIWFLFLSNFLRLMTAERQLQDLWKIIKLILPLQSRFVMLSLKDRKEKSNFRHNSKWKFKSILRISRSKTINQIQLILMLNIKKNKEKLSRNKLNNFKKKIFNNKLTILMKSQTTKKK